MSSSKAFRFQLRLGGAQQRELQRWAGGLRWVWNQALAEQRARHARAEPYAGHSSSTLPERNYMISLET
jgi:putative transposase